ncbi:unnamed protein product [Linum tenue]|uniref:Uncharacterized protein n=1 Tax=Linum tenue TaxID=586396 RepID=A0AAV0R383_9ROSI|nr:unnamed protein product [Linum tenue]
MSFLEITDLGWSIVGGEIERPREESELPIDGWKFMKKRQRRKQLKDEVRERIGRDPLTVSSNSLRLMIGKARPIWNSEIRSMGRSSNPMRRLTNPRRRRCCLSSAPTTIDYLLTFTQDARCSMRSLVMAFPHGEHSGFIPETFILQLEVFRWRQADLCWDVIATFIVAN